MDAARLCSCGSLALQRKLRMVERAASRRLLPVCCLARSDLRRRIAVSVPSTSAAEHPCARGIAGGPDKVRVCHEEFRYDSVVDYRADDFESALDGACPEGADVYFDNTAGPISDSVVQRLAVGARVVICGTASIASWDPPPQGPRVERHLLVKRARMQGFLIFDHVQRSPEALRELESWVRNGQIRYREDILDGIEQAPGSIAGLYRGENLGKRLIRIAPDVLPRDPSPTQT
jgi:NADPH-dependent curcumin reductase CurA